MLNLIHPTCYKTLKQISGTGTNLFNFVDVNVLNMLNNVSFMKYAVKAVPGLADVRVPHGVEDSPRTPAPGSGSKIAAHHVDQHEKLKGLDM